MNFYAEKSKQLPRLLYRQVLRHAISGRADDICQFANSYIQATKGPDYLKMTWVVPKYLQEKIGPTRLETFTQFIERQRARRPTRLKKAVFPHASDEFSLSDEFLSEVLDKERLCTFEKKDIVYTIGSCFARNFSKYLADKGLLCNNFGQAEDLNSPGSNQILLHYARHVDNTEELQKMEQEMRLVWADASEKSLSDMLRAQIAALRGVRDGIASATKLIITLGNTVDFYREVDGAERLVPKFLVMPASEDVRVRESVSARLDKLKTYIRLSTFEEVKRHIHLIYRHVRAINPHCNIVLTVSPVPIDSVLGLRGVDMYATEVDCVSKSTIRAALHEVMHTESDVRNDKQLHYLPSFEIVRWIAPLTGMLPFGAEDGASRHVSNAVLNAVCAFAYHPADD